MRATYYVKKSSGAAIKILVKPVTGKFLRCDCFIQVFISSKMTGLEERKLSRLTVEAPLAPCLSSQLDGREREAPASGLRMTPSYVAINRGTTTDYSPFIPFCPLVVT